MISIWRTEDLRRAIEMEEKEYLQQLSMALPHTYMYIISKLSAISRAFTSSIIRLDINHLKDIM